ncbi:hypothetical protein [Ferruginibacter sp.]
MKRRNFIISAAVVAIGLPVAYYFKKRYTRKDPLVFSDMLASFCNESELRAIGAKYREMVPAENDRSKLSNLLLTDSNNKKIGSSDADAVAALLTQKIHNEFVANNTLIIKGWFIAVTEARQCALLSLKPNT